MKRRRTRGGERETAGSRAMREGICLTYAASNYNGYNGIICLRIVAAKHCCIVKCSTTSVHHVHWYIPLFLSAMFGPADSNALYNLSIRPADTSIYTHILINTHESCAMCVEKCCIFRSYANPITRLRNDIRNDKWSGRDAKLTDS